MRAETLFIGLFLYATPAVAQSGSDLDWKQPPPLGPERSYQPPSATRLSLDGGGTLLVIENHSLPLVTVELVMPGAGSTADPKAKAGLAAYTADLLDEGAGALGARALAETIDGLGSELRTWAEEDAAHVQISALAHNLQATLDLAGKLFTAPTFDANEARRVHEDTLTAVRLRRDRPGAVARVVLHGQIYGAGAPYGHPASGTLADLARFGVADARDFHRRHYQRHELIVVVAGDVLPAEAKRLIEGALSGWKGAGGATHSAQATIRRGGSRLSTIDRVGAEQASLLLGGPGLLRSDPRSYALDVATNVLGGTFTSRLNHRLREELGYTYGASASAIYHLGTGAVAITGELVTAKTPEAIGEILRLAAEMGTTPLTSAELEATQQNLIRGLPDYFKTNDDVADAFASILVIGLPEVWFASYADRIRAVTAAQVLEVSRTVFAPDRLLAVVVGPMGEIGAGLAKLGLGAPLRHDPDGLPVKP